MRIKKKKKEEEKQGHSFTSRLNELGQERLIKVIEKFVSIGDCANGTGLPKIQLNKCVSYDSFSMQHLDIVRVMSLKLRYVYFFIALV